ncbi:MAG: four helix bundle protein, partial [Gemmatimonadota bacterium]|nr:four helix bundle protein [Gemmatimonadota bacterium]
MTRESPIILSYRDLIVWQISIATVRIVYELSRKFPNDERFGMTSQMRRAA